MNLLELLILSKISKEPGCSTEILSRSLGIPRTTIRYRSRSLTEQGYLFGEKKEDRFLTLKGASYLNEQLENLGTADSARD